MGSCGSRGGVSGLFSEEYSDVHALPAAGALKLEPWGEVGGREPLADAGPHFGVIGVGAVGSHAPLTSGAV